MNRPFDTQLVYEQNQDATIWCGNLAPQVDEEILWELFLQCGPVKSVHIPTDNVLQAHKGFGFVEMETEEDANYAAMILAAVKIYGHPLRCNKVSQDKKNLGVGAKLFIGNLAPEVDENMLLTTFSSFGQIMQLQMMRDPETKESKGFAFATYDSFDASDAALSAMHNQFLGGKVIHVEYAYKNDSKGERHGSAAERLLAKNKAALEGENSALPPGMPALPKGMPPLPKGMPALPR